MIDDVELFFGNGRTRMTSHKDSGRVLKHHENEQDELEGTLSRGSILGRSHVVVVVIVVLV